MPIIILCGLIIPILLYVRGVGNKDFPEMTAFERYSVDKADMPNQHSLVLARPAYCDEIKILGGVLPTDAASLC